MSAVSVSHSPRASHWIPDSPRRKPQSTTATAMAAPTHQPSVNHATMTSPRPADANRRDVAENVLGAGLAAQNGGGDGEIRKTAIPYGSRISFAPDTAFHDRSHLRSRGASKKVAATFNFRPFAPGEKPHTPNLRFKVPKATLPSLHYLSVSQEDFLDPRYAQDIVKTYGIPKYLFKSKSNLLTSAGRRSRLADSNGADGTTTQTGAGISSENDKLIQSMAVGKAVVVDAEGRPKTSGEPSATSNFPNRFPVMPDLNGMSIAELRSRGSSRLQARGLVSGNEESKSQAPGMAPVYKPLIGEKYTDARFFPNMNAHRSLQLESEVTKYVEHKKRVGLGRYVQFVESGVPMPPGSALMREATMYDLKNDGPAERPLDQLPDRKPFIRQRPRDPKHDFVRSSEDRADLVIMSKERTVPDMNSAVQNDVTKQ